MKKKFSNSWNKSKQTRKQRKYRYNAPLNVMQKFVSVHLSKELKEKHKKRNVGLKKGDKVKILRGQFKGKSGKVEKVELKKCKVYVGNVEVIKKDGTKILYPFEPSNLIIQELAMDDKRRVKSLERK